MTWYLEGDKAVWSEEYPGHHKIKLEFDLKELKQQLRLSDIGDKL